MISRYIYIYIYIYILTCNSCICMDVLNNIDKKKKNERILRVFVWILLIIIIQSEKMCWLLLWMLYKEFDISMKHDGW